MPVCASSSPANAVMNSDSGFSLDTSALARTISPPTSSTRRAALFSSVLESAMNKLAGRPFPETSATMKNSRLESTMKQS